MNKKITIIIGHNKIDKGAYSPSLSLSEYDYHKKVCELLKDIPNIRVLEREYKNGSYNKEMADMVERLDSEKYDLAIELHFNSASSEQPHGTETLVFYRNLKASEYSQMYFDCIRKFRPNQRIRGIIPISSLFDRGAYGILKSKGTYILVEGFFGSNPNDVISVEDYASILKDFIKEVQNGK